MQLVLVKQKVVQKLLQIKVFYHLCTLQMNKAILQLKVNILQVYAISYNNDHLHFLRSLKSP